MPIPTPKPDEEQDAFISRCMSAIGDEYDDKDQALAICFSKWKEKLIELLGPAKWKIHCEADAKVCDLCLSYKGRIFETHKIWETFPYAMPLFDNVIEPNIHPNCRCQLRLIEGIEVMKESMHKDFNKIQDEFTNYYCNSSTPCEQGTFEFNAWVSDLGLNISKPYGKSLEAFNWAQDMIAKLKEDEEAVYYKVLFAFPIESMNGNVYTEAEIKNSVKSIIGKSPSLNHWEDTRKLFEEGGVKYIGAEYEDGACEALLKVPKDFVCPMCGEGKTLTSLIDDKKIVNVSLECTCELVGPGNTCIGLEFDAPTLLTSTKLPGFPMARIFPLEKIFSEALVQKRGGKRLEVKVVGLEQELPDAQHQCPEGQIWNDEMGQCVEDKTCPEGQHWDDASGACVPDEKGPPEGTDVKLGVPAAGDTSKDAIEAMTEDELVKAITDIAAKIDKYYDDDIDTTEIEPLHAQLVAYQDALKALIQQKALSSEDFKDALEVKCPEGMVWDPDAATCVQVEQIIKCPEGQIWDPDTQKCITPASAPTVTNQPVNEAQLYLQLSDAQLKEFKANQKSMSLEGQVANLENIVSKKVISETNIKAELNAEKKQGTRSQAENIRLRDSVMTLETRMSKMTIEHRHQVEDLEKSRDFYKDRDEVTTPLLKETTEKYNKMLKANLSITNKLTTAQEEILETSKRNVFLESQLKKAKRLSKVVVKMDIKPSGD